MPDATDPAKLLEEMETAMAYAKSGDYVRAVQVLLPAYDCIEVFQANSVSDLAQLATTTAALREARERIGELEATVAAMEAKVLALTPWKGQEQKV